MTLIVAVPHRYPAMPGVANDTRQGSSDPNAQYRRMLSANILSWLHGYCFPSNRDARGGPRDNDMSRARSLPHDFAEQAALFWRRRRGAARITSNQSDDPLTQMQAAICPRSENVSRAVPAHVDGIQPDAAPGRKRGIGRRGRVAQCR